MTNITSGLQAGALSERAVLVNLSLSQWTARKYDRKASDEVIAANGAESAAGRFNKLLLHGDELRAVQQHVNLVRTRHYTLTLPWLDEGWRLLSVQAFIDYAAEMDKHRIVFERLVQKLAARYSALRDDARRSLGSLYRETDYPATITDRFGFAMTFHPVPDRADDFRVNLPAEHVAAMAASAEQRAEEAIRVAMRDAWERVHEVVKHMADKLGTSDAIFRDSLVDNVRELVDVLPGLNVMGDAGLAAMTDLLRKSLTRHEADDLRADKRLRKRTADEAARLLADIDKNLGALCR